MTSSQPRRRAPIRLRQTAGIAVLALALGTAPAPTAGANLEGVRAADRIEVGDTPLVLHRMALFRWMRLLKVYVASLYLPADASPAAVLEDLPKRLEIHYFREFAADQFRKSTTHFIEKNVGASEYANLAPRIDRFNRLYRDVEPGDRYSVSYAPGLGTELALNGDALGRVEGADFAAAVFSIWLGEQPFDEGLKRELLEPR